MNFYCALYKIIFIFFLDYYIVICVRPLNDALLNMMCKDFVFHFFPFIGSYNLVRFISLILASIILCNSVAENTWLLALNFLFNLLLYRYMVLVQTLIHYVLVQDMQLEM